MIVLPVHISHPKAHGANDFCLPSSTFKAVWQRTRRWPMPGMIRGLDTRHCGMTPPPQLNNRAG
jgi:hypothetical protein